MDLTVNTLSILNRINFADGTSILSSYDQTKNKLLGVLRNSETNTFSITDRVLCNRDLEVSSYLLTPQVRIQSVSYRNDLDEMGLPSIQNIAFTELLRQSIIDNASQMTTIAQMIDTTTKQISCTSIEFLNDLDNLVPRSQAKAFTDQNATDILSNKTLLNSFIPSILNVSSKSITLDDTSNKILLDDGVISVSDQANTTKTSITKSQIQLIAPGQPTITLSNGKVDCGSGYFRVNNNNMDFYSFNELFFYANSVNAKMKIPVSGPIIMNTSLSLTHTAAANRIFQGSTFALTNTVDGSYSSIITAKIYDDGVDLYIKNTVLSGSTIISGNGVYGDTNLLYINLDSIKSVVPINTFITSGVSAGNDIATFSTNDSSCSLRGLSIYPASSTGINPITDALDAVISSRKGIATAQVLTLTNFSSLTNGIRIANDGTTATLKIQCGSNSFLMDSSQTRTDMNHILKFSGSLASSREIQNVTKYNLADIQLGSGIGSISLDSTMPSGYPGITYNCDLANGFHNFGVMDGSSVKSYPLKIDKSRVTVNNMLSIASPDSDGNRLDISHSSNTTTMKIKCNLPSNAGFLAFLGEQTNASSVPTNHGIITLSPYGIFISKPIQFQYSTQPATLLHLGYIYSSQCTYSNVISSSAIRPVQTIALGDPTNFPATNGSYGTYLVTWQFSVAVNTPLLSTASFSALEFAISNVANNSFDSNTYTYPSYKRLIRIYPSITEGTSDILETTSCVIRYNSSASSYIYLNYLATFTGSTLIRVGGYVTITRIG